MNPFLRNHDDLLSIEEQSLGPFAARAPGRGRRYPETPDPYRTPFQRDRDRIVHAWAFRRLQSKTQVYAVDEAGDRARTRLTHSLEVAQIARALARSLGGNPDLAEAVALAHDIGHPPFGHGGERVLAEVTREASLPAFDHNRQTLRILDDLESPYAQHRGLNLTFETREGVSRHETPYDTPSVDPEFQEDRQPSIEAQTVNVADFVAYVTHDLEDAIRLGLVRREECASVGGGLVAEAADEATAHRQKLDPSESERGEDVALRAMIRCLIRRLVGGCLDESSARLGSLPEATLDALRTARRPSVALPDSLAEEADLLLTFLHREVYEHPRVLVMIEKGCRALRDLYGYFIARPSHLPREVQCAYGIRPKQGPGNALGIVDYLASLTDREVTGIHRAVFEV